LLLKAVNSYSGTDSSDIRQALPARRIRRKTRAHSPADESEYNDINTDRELFAIHDISRSLA